MGDATEHRESLRGARSRVKVVNHFEDTALTRLLPLARHAMGEIAPAESIRRVAARNPDSLWLFSRIEDKQPEGFQAFLLLNSVGRSKLLDGTLSLFEPPEECLVAQSERPALIYVWAAYTPGVLAAGMSTMLDHFASPRYAGIDMVARAASLRGERAITRIGFRKGWRSEGKERPDLFHWSRSRPPESTLRPTYDSYDPVHRPTGITVVHDISDFLKVAAIRSAVYMGEQDCPYDEEFDGNDFAATHLLAYVDGEPAGCMRARFFADFAKLERLAVRRNLRTSKTAFRLVRASIDLCRAKGYRKIYGHARVELLKFWRSFDFHLKEGDREFRFSDQNYVEISSDFQPANDAVLLGDDPYRMIRPEGRWHLPGILEESAERSSNMGSHGPG